MTDQTPQTPPRPGHDDSLALRQFNIKLRGRKGRKNVLISAGTADDKVRMLPSMTALADLGVNLYCTAGTSAFLKEHGIPNQELYKVSEEREPNINSFLQTDQFDMVINIVRGDNDYDEASDYRLIRKLSIENEIPLFTEVPVAELAIQRMVARTRETRELGDREPPGRPWDLKEAFHDLILERGGFANYHAHFDKAYLINIDDLMVGEVDMQKKWKLYQYLQETYTHRDLVRRITRCVKTMINQGVRACRTHVDASATTGLLPIQALLEVRERFRNQIYLEVGIQPLSGVLDPESRAVFEQACALADVIGGLPSRDRPTPEKHLDVLMGIAKDLGKPLDIHVDQENNPDEDECELLARKSIEHGLEGRVNAIHAISLGAKAQRDQDRVARLMRDAGMSVTICPSAALSMKPLDKLAPIHNSIAPLRTLLAHEIPVRLGVDNMADLFMPLTDGDMWFECRLLMEACRFYDLDTVAAMASDRSGFVNQEGIARVAA